MSKAGRKTKQILDTSQRQVNSSFSLIFYKCPSGEDLCPNGCGECPSGFGKLIWRTIFYWFSSKTLFVMLIVNWLNAKIILLYHYQFQCYPEEIDRMEWQRERRPDDHYPTSLFFLNFIICKLLNMQTYRKLMDCVQRRFWVPNF